jgi:hypothetical protein
LGHWAKPLAPLAVHIAGLGLGFVITNMLEGPPFPGD